MTSLIKEAFGKDRMSFGARVGCFLGGIILDPINLVAAGLEKLGVDNPSVDWDNERDNPSSAMNSYP